MKRLLIILSTIFVLTACSKVQKIENGQIPNEYINQIQPFLGDWSGSFNYHMGTLHLSLNESNQLIVEFTDGATNDFIPGCKSSIGLLKEVEFDKDNGEVQIKRATFDIDTNRCSRSIVGQQIHFEFYDSHTTTMLKLVHKQWRDYVCREVGRDPNGAPIRECNHEIRNQYLTGRFAQSRD